MQRRSALAALADVVGVLLFCLVGRRSHAEGLTVAGVAETAPEGLPGKAGDAGVPTGTVSLVEAPAP